MPLRSDWSHKPCPIARGLEVLGDPWSMMVLREAFFGNRRFGDIQERLGIAESVLSKRLLWLSGAGLLVKTPYDDDAGRTRHEYRLTPKGQDALPVLNAMAQWADKHEVPCEATRMLVIHTGCGNETTSADTCTHCGAALDAAQTSWHSPVRSEHPIRLATAEGSGR